MTLLPFLLSVPTPVAASVWTVALAVSVIMDEDFETTSVTSSALMTTANITGWSTTGYNLLCFPGTAN